MSPATVVAGRAGCGWGLTGGLSFLLSGVPARLAVVGLAIAGTDRMAVPLSRAVMRHASDASEANVIHEFLDEFLTLRSLIEIGMQAALLVLWFRMGRRAGQREAAQAQAVECGARQSLSKDAV